MSWTPLFTELVDSSVWRLPSPTRLAWITILAKKHYRTHKIRTNPSLLAEWARITTEEAATALTTFLSPDPSSLNPSEEGRRIKEVGPNEYLVINGKAYADRMRSEVDREQARRRMQALRASRAEPEEDDPNVINTNGGVAKPTNYWSMARKVLEYFNEVAGTDFIASDNSALNSICQCLAMDAVTFDGVKAMIDNQVAEKRGTPNEKWLTPTILFDIEKFGGFYGRRNTQVSKNHHVNPVAQLKSVEATIADINKKLTAFESVDASSQPEKAKRVAEQKKPLLDERRVLKETQSRLNREIAAMKQ